MKILVFVACLLTASCAVADLDYPIRSPRMTDVKVTRGFWFDRLETNRTATLTSNWAKCNETPRVANFTNAAIHAIGTFGGKTFPTLKATNGLKLIPYCLWGNREPGNELQVWLKER